MRRLSKSEVEINAIDWTQDGQLGFDEKVVRAAVPNVRVSVSRLGCLATDPQSGFLHTSYEPSKESSFRAARSESTTVQAFERQHNPALHLCARPGCGQGWNRHAKEFFGGFCTATIGVEVCTCPGFVPASYESEDAKGCAR